MHHHDLAVEAYVARTAVRPEVLGILVTGSVARGSARPDSDVDLVTVVTDAEWAAAVREQRTMVVEHEGAAYPGGYFDVKLATPTQLRAAAERGDDPVRASIGDAKVVYDQGFDFEDLVRAVDRSGREDGSARAAAHLAQARLHGEYFLEQGLARGDAFLAAHAAVHLGLAAGRTALAVEGVRYPGPKDLLAAVRALPGTGAPLAAAIEAVADRPGTDAARHLLDLVERLAGHLLPDAATLSRFVQDNELAWFRGTVPPEHW